jgi:hypothetical protein
MRTSGRLLKRIEDLLAATIEQYAAPGWTG